MRAFLHMKWGHDLATLQEQKQPPPPLLSTKFDPEYRTKNFIQLAEAEKLFGTILLRLGYLDAIRATMKAAIERKQEKLTQAELVLSKEWLEQAKRLKVLSRGHDVYPSPAERMFEEDCQKFDRFIESGGAFYSGG